MKKLLRVGIVGCGAIGSKIAEAVVNNFNKDAKLAAVCDINRKNVTKLQRRVKSKVKNVCLNELVKRSDLVIEAASKDISAKIAAKAVSKGKDVLVMSVGGLLGRDDILANARKRRVSIYLPSGAICGLDGLRALGFSKIKSVTLTTRKPVRSLPARFSNIKKETIIFKGSASEAVKKFPKNINVAATLSLAGLGARRTRVRIIASPKYRRNMHEIEIESDAARLLTRTENVPSPDNPKTSYLAVLSAIATLAQIFDNVRIGT